jgi:hypothetical protein
VYVAGDWVGPRGWLADASLSSGEAAGLAAARPAAIPVVDVRADEIGARRTRQDVA